MLGIPTKSKEPAGMNVMFGISTIIRNIFSNSQIGSVSGGELGHQQKQLQALGLNEFLNLDIPPREMLLDPILPEKSLAMLYAPRGIGKSWLGLSIGLTVASRSNLLRWSAPLDRRVLYVDGEMPLASLQERIRLLSAGYSIPNDGFRLLAADNVEGGINLGTNEGQEALDPLLRETDLLILDNLSTLCANRSESASDAWTPVQEWLLKLRRRGISVFFIHHAGTNGRQRGTSRREDVLDTVIALRRPEDYSQDQGARFEIHFEKLRNRVHGDGGVPFEASIEVASVDGLEVIRWSSRDLRRPGVERAAEMFKEGLTVREVASNLRISKSEAGRLRLRALQDGLLSASMANEESSLLS